MHWQSLQMYRCINYSLEILSPRNNFGLSRECILEIILFLFWEKWYLNCAKLEMSLRGNEKFHLLFFLSNALKDIIVMNSLVYYFFKKIDCMLPISFILRQMRVSGDIFTLFLMAAKGSLTNHLRKITSKEK